jgi:hypothetical protein
MVIVSLLRLRELIVKREPLDQQNTIPWPSTARLR